MAPRQDDDEISIADDMLRSGYDRWHRLEEEKAAIGEDLKELFAELKANGFAPKALRESFRRVRNVDDASQQEHDAIVDLYVASLTGARPARTREGDDEADADGVVERITQPSGEFNSAAASNSDADAPVPTGAAEIATPPAVSAPIQAEEANQLQKAAGETIPTDQPGARAEGSPEIGRNPEPNNSLTGSAADKSAGGGISPAPVAPTKLKMNAEFFDEPHPACQRPTFCGGNSNVALCDECKARAGIAGSHDGPTFQPEASVH